MPERSTLTRTRPPPSRHVGDLVKPFPQPLLAHRLSFGRRLPNFISATIIAAAGCGDQQSADLSHKRNARVRDPVGSGSAGLLECQDLGLLHVVQYEWVSGRRDRGFDGSTYRSADARLDHGRSDGPKVLQRGRCRRHRLWHRRCSMLRRVALHRRRRRQRVCCALFGSSTHAPALSDREQVGAGRWHLRGR